MPQSSPYTPYRHALETLARNSGLRFGLEDFVAGKCYRIHLITPNLETKDLARLIYRDAIDRKGSAFVFAKPIGLSKHARLSQNTVYYDQFTGKRVDPERIHTLTKLERIVLSLQGDYKLSRIELTEKSPLLEEYELHPVRSRYPSDRVYPETRYNITQFYRAARRSDTQFHLVPCPNPNTNPLVELLSLYSRQYPGVEGDVYRLALEEIKARRPLIARLSPGKPSQSEQLRLFGS